MLKRILPLAILPFLSLVQPAAAQPPLWWQANPDSPYYQDGGGDYGSDNPEAVYGPDPYATRGPDFDEQQYRMYRREMARRYQREHRYQQYGQQQDYGDNQPYAAPVYPVQPKGKVIVQANKPVVKKKAPAKPATTTASTATTSSVTTSKATVATTAAATTTTTVATTAPATTTTVASTAPASTPNVASTAPATTPNVASTKPAASTVPATATASTTPATTKKGGAVTCDKGASIVSSFGFEKVASKSCAAATLVYSAERGGKPFEIEVNPKSGELTAVKKL